MKLAALLVIGIVLASACTQQAGAGDTVLSDGTIQKADGTMIKPDGTIIKTDGTMILPDGTMVPPEGEMMEDENMSDDDAMEKNDSIMEGDAMMKKYSGAVLAGSAARLLDFNQADYEKALASEDVVLLYFYADWCPICKAEVPKMYEAFNELSADNVVGFRVNYNDGQTDDNERALASAHGVAYQHTKVLLKNGERVLKSPETWSKERYLSEINNVLAA